MMAKPSAKKPARAKASPRHRHHHHPCYDPEGGDLGMEGDGVAAVVEGAYAVSDAAGGSPVEEDFGGALREAADAVARAEARLAEIGEDLHEAAVYSEELIREAVETEKRAVDQAAAAQKQAIAAAQDAIARALAATADAAGRIEHGGVRSLPPGRRYET